MKTITVPPPPDLLPPSHCSPSLTQWAMTHIPQPHKLPKYTVEVSRVSRVSRRIRSCRRSRSRGEVQNPSSTCIKHGGWAMYPLTLLSIGGIRADRLQLHGECARNSNLNSQGHCCRRSILQLSANLDVDKGPHHLPREPLHPPTKHHRSRHGIASTSTATIRSKVKEAVEEASGRRARRPVRPD